VFCCYKLDLFDGDDIIGVTNGITVAGQIGVAGSWSYQFSSPTAVTFDQYGNMYVMDSGNTRIQRWWPGSTYGVTVASASMSSPRGMRFDSLGNLVVVDASNDRVLSFPVVCREYSSFL
jgi:DNA-binding beta-propeller fold protein YncE